MKTLLESKKSKLFLTIFGTSILISNIYANEKELSYADIKSKVIQKERAFIMLQRDNLANKITNNKSHYTSNQLVDIREFTRYRRIK